MDFGNLQFDKILYFAEQCIEKMASFTELPFQKMVEFAAALDERLLKELLNLICKNPKQKSTDICSRPFCSSGL